MARDIIAINIDGISIGFTKNYYHIDTLFSMTRSIIFFHGYDYRLMIIDTIQHHLRYSPTIVVVYR